MSMAGKVAVVVKDNGQTGGTPDGDTVWVAEGTKAECLFAVKFPGRNVTKYLIRVNGQSNSNATILKTGDEVSITPADLKGAWGRLCGWFGKKGTRKFRVTGVVKTETR